MPSLNNSDKQKGHTYVQWIVAMIANTTLLTYGLQAGWITPMARVLQSKDSPTGYPLSDHEITWVASSLCITAIFGVSLFSYIVDAYGRRLGVLIMAVLQAVCWIIKLSSANTISIIIARLCCGIPAGACYNVVPMYVREISDDRIRGKLGSLLILFQNTGVLVVFAMGAYMEYYTVLWIVVWLPIITILLMVKAPESPAFLVKIGEYDKAASTLSLLRGLDVNNKVIQNEIESMKNEEATSRTAPNVSFISIFKNKVWRRGFILIMSLVTFQSSSGNFAIMTYASAILSSSGVTFSQELQALSLPVVMILGSFISMTCVERFGRKLLITTTFMLAALCMATLATTMLMQNQGANVPTWLPITALATFVCAYASGVSPMPYIIMAEMFNFQIRAKIMGCFVTHAWFLSFVQLATFTPISNTLGPYTTFYCFTVLNLCGALASLLFLPETKGKSVAEIEMDLGKNI